MDGIVLMSDPRVAAVAVEECGEPLVDCRTRFHVDERRSDPEGHWAHLRAGVADRLALAERSLPYDWCWLLVEGYRSPTRQREIYDGYAASLRRLRPEATEAELACAAARWVAPSHTAGHVAGAAVDLTVRTRDGTEVDMGCPEAATPEESAGACCTAAPDLPAHARRNRGAMIHALRSAGMVNYPTEWWHWSYGDRYWAFTARARSAPYGPTDPP